MKTLLIALLLIVIVNTSSTANERDSLWRRNTSSDIKELDFTPDDKYVIAWTNSLEFWNVETATMDYIVPDIKVGGITSDEKSLVFIQDGVPKMLDIETKEIIDGFEPPTFQPNHVKVGNDNNIFMCFNEKDSLFIWDIATKKIEKVFSIETEFVENGDEFRRKITDYGFAGKNDEFLFVSTLEENKYSSGHPSKIFRRASKFYKRNDFELYDSLQWVSNYELVNSNKDLLGITYQKGIIYYYDLKSKSIKDEIIVFDKIYHINTFSFSNNNQFLGTATNQQTKILDVQSKKTLETIDFGVEYVKFSNNDSTFVVGDGNAIVIYNINNIKSNIEDKESNIEFNLYPNPTNQSIRISYIFKGLTKYKISLYDVAGNFVSIVDESNLNVLNYNFEFNISFLPIGSYFIQLEYDESVIIKQFLKE